MANTYTFCINSRYQDCSAFIVKNTTTYGTDAPDRRQDHAEYFQIAKMDENQGLTFITTVDNSTPLADLEYTVSSMGDGAYRIIYWVFPLYDNAATYTPQVYDSTTKKVTTYGHVIYHSDSGKYFKAVYTGAFSGIQPTVTSGWESYWQEFNFADEVDKQYINSDKLTVVIKDDGTSCAYEACLVKSISDTATGLCGNCSDQQFMKTLKAQFMLDAANAELWQDKATRYETIITEASKRYCDCGCSTRN